MATEQDQQSHQQLQQQQQQQQQQQRHLQPRLHPADSIWNIIAEKRPSTPQLVTLLVLLPLGATLLLLAGVTLAATIVCLLIVVPLLLLFSPIIVPAVVTVGLAVLGILTSGAFGVTGLASFLWLANYLRTVRPRQEAAAYLGRRTDKLGLKIEQKGQEVVKAHEGART